MRNPAVSDLHKDMRSLITRAKRAKLLQPEPAFTTIAMLSVLPAKAAMDSLAVMYFDNFEITHRILHEPSFWRDYKEFWKDTNKNDPSFLVVLLLIVSTVCTMSAKEPLRFVGKNSSARETAIRLIYTCEAWLQRQSHKHLTLALVQIRCLIVVAKQMNRIKKKRAWTVAGDLVRFGMSVGLHRDASVLEGKVSIFAQELRKRLWATIVELELQASFDRGMPSSSVSTSCNCGAPANISDSHLQESAEESLISEDPGIWTATSYLRLSRSSVAMRASLNQMINGPQEELEYEDMLAWDKRIRKHLQSLPNWQDGNVDTLAQTQYPMIPGHPRVQTPASHKNQSEFTNDAPTRTEDQKRTICRSLLDLQLRQYLIPLHSPFVRRIRADARYQYSVMVCYETANKILDLHTKLVANGVDVLNLFRDDVLGPALSICLSMYCSASIEGKIFKFSRSFMPDGPKTASAFEV